ncbi:MAG: chromosome segregation protein SMC, partial [Pseudoflavonifractor sp.]
MLSEMEKLFEGYSKAVKVVMGDAERGQLKGIHGPVAGLIHVPDQYAVAIEIALGSAMQNIVVETEENGKQAINYLKSRDAGRATFLPLTSIRPSEFRDGKVVDEPGFVGMGDELITFDRKYDKVFSSLLGRTVIAENMDRAIAIARKYSYHFRIVTLDGQVLNPGGSMTGGSVSRSAGILSRANELERLNTQVEGIAQDLRAAALTLEETTREVTAAGYEMETAQAQQRQHEDAILTLEERCNHFGTLLSDLRRQAEDQRAELEQIQKRSVQTEQDTKNARARIETLEGAAAGLRAEAEGKAKGQSEIQDKVAAIGGEIADLNMRLAGLDAERLASQQALTELEGLRRDMTGDRDQRCQMIEDLKAKNEGLSAEILERETALQAIRSENQGRKEAIDQLNAEKLALEADRNRADKDSRDKNAELLAMEREVSVLEQRKVTAALEEKQILDKLWETYELSHEAARAQRVELESVQKAQRRIAELKRGIGALGNINLDAIDEFQRVNERYTYLTDQRDDVQKA